MRMLVAILALAFSTAYASAGGGGSPNMGRIHPTTKQADNTHQHDREKADARSSDVETGTVEKKAKPMPPTKGPK